MNRSTKMHMKQRILQFFFFILTCCCAIPATAQELRIAVLDLPPYGYREGNRTVGLNADICERIAEEAGFQPRTTLVPLARGVKEFESGHVDMIALLPNPEVARVGEDIGTIMVAEVVVMGRSGTVFRSIADLGGKRVAKIRGAGYGRFLASLPQVVVCDTDSYAQNFRMLFAGRVDAVIGPKLGLYYVARSLGLSRNLFGPPLILAEQTGYIYVSRRTTNPAERERLARAHARLREQGVFHRMIEDYVFP